VGITSFANLPWGGGIIGGLEVNNLKMENLEKGKETTYEELRAERKKVVLDAINAHPEIILEILRSERDVRPKWLTEIAKNIKTESGHFFITNNTYGGDVYGGGLSHFRLWIREPERDSINYHFNTNESLVARSECPEEDAGSEIRKLIENENLELVRDEKFENRRGIKFSRLLEFKRKIEDLEVENNPKI